MICELKTTLYRSNLSEKTYKVIFEADKNKDSRKLIMRYMDLLGFLGRPGNKFAKVKMFRESIKDFFPATVAEVDAKQLKIVTGGDLKENKPSMSKEQMLAAGYNFDVLTGEQINPDYVKDIDNGDGYDGYTGLPVRGPYQHDVDAAMRELFPNDFSHRM